MKIFVEYFYIFIFVLIFGGSSRANQYCSCISSTTFPEDDGFRYVAKCVDAHGNDRETLLDTRVKLLKEAHQKTQGFMNSYQIKANDCYQMPGGKMIYAPKSTK